LVYTRGGVAWSEVPEIAELKCRDPFYRSYESHLRCDIFRAALNDDSIFEPYLTVHAAHKCAGWGMGGRRQHSETPRGSWKAEYPIKRPEDIEKLQPPRHEIDEAETARRVEKLAEAVGDIIAIDVDRAPAYRMWTADISTDLGYLRGIENFMLDMMDNPSWLHRLLAFMRDGVLRAHDQAEAAGDWGLSAHQNQAMPYAAGLAPPAANARGVKRGELWGFAAAQEFTLVSPKMHDEFLFRYQMPILEKFGLTAYGCCEDLTNKIDMLRQLGNLRRIAVAPVADLRKCAEQIGTDYVISWRPSPAEMVCCGFDAARVRKVTMEAMDICRGLHVDVTLKDVHTVQGCPQRLADWTRITREVVER